jgi:TatD DNase family protein
VPTAAEYVDSHCHVADPEFDADREAVVARAIAAGVRQVLVVGVFDEARSHARALETAEAHGFPCAVGLHPHEARLGSGGVYEAIEDLARSRRIVAIGEIGLDYHYDHSPREAQRGAFRRQIRLARALGLPIVVHTREAEDDTLAILADEHAGEVGGVFHCFSGDARLAQQALALGFYISFSGIVAFPRAQALREVARCLPSDRLLIETDAPYLAPPPHRGQRNEPAFVVEVAGALAGARGATPEEIGRATLENFRRCFRL